LNETPITSAGTRLPRRRRWPRSWPGVSPTLVAATALLLAAGCRSKQKTALERGAGVYTRSCASCHGTPGRSQGRTLGFEVRPPDLAEPAVQKRLSDSDIRRTVREGKGQMPPFGRMLSATELNQLVEYLRSFQPGADAAR
jgi:mono/diheme cytochrome c family protein